MKMILIASILSMIICIQLSGTSSSKNTSVSDPIHHFNIKLLPGAGALTSLPCVYWEYNIPNADNIELYFKDVGEDKKIFSSNVFKFNSWKDKGITHCPFKLKQKNSRTAIYFYKIKLKNSAHIFTRTFVVNREDT